MTGVLTSTFSKGHVNEDNDILHSPPAGGSWPITKMDRNPSFSKGISSQHPRILKSRATMPILSRSQTQRSFSSILDFVQLTNTSESAVNGSTMSRLRHIFWQAIDQYSPLSPVAAMMVSVQSRSPSSGVFLALSCGIPREAKVSRCAMHIEAKANDSDLDG